MIILQTDGRCLLRRKWICDGIRKCFTALTIQIEKIMTIVADKAALALVPDQTEELL